jgi:PhzF family phenazine biosynthesis protein
LSQTHNLRLYQVDAFARRPFTGNPAAVCPLASWLADDVLQAIAEENNLSETAFFVPSARGFRLRWFTPLAEVDLCGHATLAAAHVLYEVMGYAEPAITFETRSGELIVTRNGSLLTMDFPAQPAKVCAAPEALLQGLGGRPSEVRSAADYLVVFESEAEVRALVPDQGLLARLDLRGVIVTAPGADGDCDFVSRFFAPRVGVPEDPVTGSAHCALAPYWAERLGKTKLVARQVSRRGGELLCAVKGERVLISGSAVTVLAGTMTFTV